MSKDHNQFENGTETNWTTIDNMIIDDEINFDNPGEKLTFIVALRHAFQLEQDARPSQKTMAKKACCSERSIRNYLKSLQTKGFLEKRGIHEDTQAVIWRVTIPDEMKIAWTEKQLEKQKQKLANKKQQEPQQEPQRDQPPFEEIIGYLNEKAGTRFKPTSKVPKQNINARWSEGWRTDDFKYVIDVKVNHWLGDPEMENNLNPGTLFGVKYFEKYRNQKPKKKSAKSKNEKTYKEQATTHNVNHFYPMPDGRMLDLRKPEERKIALEAEGIN